MISLEGKVAVVTGASRGIGAAVARMLADQGVKLGLASRSGDDLGIAGRRRHGRRTCATARRCRRSSRRRRRATAASTS